MRWIELQNVEYGECIVLGGKSSILMNDCGSMSQKLRQGDISIDDCFESIAMRYEPYPERYFLLSHYHRDHLSGFMKILQKYPGYFSRVLIPSAPCDASGRALLLDLAIYAHLFLPYQTDCSQVNTSCMRIFKILSDKAGAERIFTLQRGDRFRFDEVDYEVLWPRPQDYPFDPELRNAVERLDLFFASPYLSGPAGEFTRVRDRFTALYLQCCDAFAVSGRAVPETRRELLHDLLQAQLELEALREPLMGTPQAHDVQEILASPLVLEAYTVGANAASVIYQNVRTREASLDDILMTGDCTPESIAAIWDDLYDSYYVLKTPHHGTAAGYSSLFSEMGISHILISNGDYHAGGAISDAYAAMQDTVKHCTGNLRCKWFGASGSCCNRLTYCYDQSAGAGLVIKCPAVRPPMRNLPGCRIRSVHMGNTTSCLCDTLADKRQKQ